MQTFSVRKTIFSLVAIALLALLAIPGSVAQAEDAQWRARFWNNKDMSGDPVLERQDNTIDFDWGQGSPGGNVNNDNFSARWNRTVNFAPGTYRFNATMDDGMRVYLDNNVIIDSWTDSQEHTMTRDIYVDGGDHALKVEFYDAGGAAVAKFNWQLIQPDGGSGGGSGGGQFYPNWKGEYFNNTSLSGLPVLTRDDRYVTNNWGTGSPAPGVVNNDFFSARWTKTLNYAPGNYTILMTSDDGSRLYLNNNLAIDNWAVQAPTQKQVSFYHAGGAMPVTVEFFDQTENASIEVHLIGAPGGGGSVNPPATGGTCATPQASTAYVNTGRLNFREGPAVQFDVVETLPQCTVVTLTGYRNPVEASVPWVQAILPDGQSAWASADYLVLGTPLDQMTVLSD